MVPQSFDLEGGLRVDRESPGGLRGWDRGSQIPGGKIPCNHDKYKQTRPSPPAGEFQGCGRLSCVRRRAGWEVQSFTDLDSRVAEVLEPSSGIFGEAPPKQNADIR